MVRGSRVIVVKNLKKVYEDDVTVLKDINMVIEDGDIYGLVGRSGAGKSTLLRCMNGLTDYQEGSLTVDGCEISSLKGKELREFRKNMGMIFQQFSLLERKTVYQNVALPMECWKASKEEKDKKVKELLKLVGLEDKMHVKPRQLSGGQKQRVAIARALTMDPKILLCDEATSALDPKTTSSILDLLIEINQKIGITIIVVTHQMEVVQKVCRHISILEHGCIAAQGEVKEIFMEQPPALKRLLGTESVELSDTGINLQIAYFVHNTEDGKLISNITRKLDVSFSIVDGQIQEYQNEKFAIFVLNIQNTEDLQKITEYLDIEKITWRVLDKTQEDEDGEV
jgi:D-methionine transport system ATP-binding protein